MVPNLKSKVWLAVTYPDSTTHFPVETIETNLSVAGAQYAYILHNRDFDIVAEKPKKPHIHWFIVFPTPRYLSAIKALLNVEYAEIPNTHPNCAFRYLAHLDEITKTRYDVAEIIGNMPVHIFEQYLTKPDPKKGEENPDLKVVELLNDLEALSEHRMSYRAFLMAHKEHIYKVANLQLLLELVRSPQWADSEGSEEET